MPKLSSLETKKEFLADLDELYAKRWDNYRPRLAISFSGGRTSAFMTKLLLDELSSTHDIEVVFANTGCEHEGTLNYIRDLQKEFGWKVTWVEYVGVVDKLYRHKEVTYETASRNGEPFEKAIQDYGLPCQTHPLCTRLLKADVIKAYLRDGAGWPTGSYDLAIGIRADEADRISVNARKKRIVYPLIRRQIYKAHILTECAKWPVKLELPGTHYGNCVWCWKKSLRKLYTLAKEDRSIFDFPLRMEEKYTPKDYERKLFRGAISTKELLHNADTLDFVPFKDNADPNSYADEIDFGLGCGESCEIETDETE